MERKKKRGTPMVLPLVIIILCGVLCAGLIAARLRGGSPSRAQSAAESGTAALSEGRVNMNQLLKLENPAEIDLRGAEMSREDIDRLREAFPACCILWDVPLSGGSWSSAAEQISLTAFNAADEELFAYFTGLKTINATAAGLSIEEYQALCAASGAEVQWMVPLGDQCYDSCAQEITVSGVSCGQLRKVLHFFPALQNVSLSNSNFEIAQQLSLAADYPAISWAWPVTVGSKTIESAREEIVFQLGSDGTLKDLLQAAPLLNRVKNIDLGEAELQLQELGELSAAYPEASVLCRTTLGGIGFSTAEEELDFSGKKNIDLADFDRLVPVMGSLKKVVMSDCGFDDQTMDDLNRRFSDVQFVWTVYLTRYYPLRTDATYFCASDRPNAGNVAITLTDEEIYPLRYCTRITALDLGHERNLTNIDFLRDMKDLRYLVLGFCYGLKDMSVLGELPELYYLELENCVFADISPLTNCKKLAYLNLANTKGYDASPILEMTSLTHLWWQNYHLVSEEPGFMDQLKEALPETEIFTGNADHFGGWKVLQGYYEMRDIFGMFY